MDKDLKFYVAPEVELVDLELEAQLLAGSDEGGAELPEYREEED